MNELKGVWFKFIIFYYNLKSTRLHYANSVDPDQTPHHAASDLGLHDLPMCYLWKTMH